MLPNVWWSDSVHYLNGQGNKVIKSVLSVCPFVWGLSVCLSLKYICVYYSVHHSVCPRTPRGTQQCTLAYTYVDTSVRQCVHHSVRAPADTKTYTTNLINAVQNVINSDQCQSIQIRSMPINADPINAAQCSSEWCRSIQIQSMPINTDPINADQYWSDQCWSMQIWSMLINTDQINADSINAD